MFLYHGTSESVARKALLEGLKPRGRKRSTWSVASARDRVYLTTAYAPYFAANASADKNERWAIIEIDTEKLSPSLLVPDEDWLEQSSRTESLRMSMRDRTRFFRDHVQDYQEMWTKSLEGLGNCAYTGVIPARAITRVVFYDPKSNPSMTLRALDPTITLLNYQYCGEKYRSLIQWFFTDVPPETIFDEMERTWFKSTAVDFQKVMDRKGIELIDRQPTEAYIVSPKNGDGPHGGDRD